MCAAAAASAATARALSRLDGIEAGVAPLAPEDPLRKAETLRAGLNLYVGRFGNVVAAQRTLGFSEKDGLQGRLRQAVHAVEKRLGEFDEPRLAVLMLQMRRHEKDFLLRGDERYGDDTKNFPELIHAAIIANGTDNRPTRRRRHASAGDQERRIRPPRSPSLAVAARGAAGA